MDLSNEIHHTLTADEMRVIRPWREQLAYKTEAQTRKLYHQWAVSGQLNAQQHSLLGIYIFDRR